MTHRQKLANWLIDDIQEDDRLYPERKEPAIRLEAWLAFQVERVRLNTVGMLSRWAY